MPVNRNALVRYKTIDKCLQNPYRLWTLDDLIDACSDALYEYEGITKGVSKRTIQADLQMMRSDKLGYNAPIIVNEKKFYTYEDKDYSITNIPISNQDLEKLNESVDFLKQFKGFSHFKNLDGIIQKLEDHVYSQKTNQKPVIDFEKNNELKGIKFLDTLYQSIIKKQAILLSYQSFNARNKSTFDFHPFLLKEYRNRWFIFGRTNKQNAILNLALDRIVSIDKTSTKYIEPSDFDNDKYFKDTIGVSVYPNQKPEKIILAISRKHAPYILTKPFHPSQKLVETNYYDVIISLEVHHNFELEKEILGLGEGIRVIKPLRLKRIISERLANANDQYKTELNAKGLKNINNQLAYKGYSIFANIFTMREIKKLNSIIDTYIQKTQKQIGIISDFDYYNKLLINRNINDIRNAIDSKAVLVEASYFQRDKLSKSDKKWHQEKIFNFENKIQSSELEEISNNEGVYEMKASESLLQNTFFIIIPLNIYNKHGQILKIFPGSHKIILDEEKIQTIAENSNPNECEVNLSGILITKPLLVQASEIIKQRKQQRLIVLKFVSKRFLG